MAHNTLEQDQLKTDSTDILPPGWAKPRLSHLVESAQSGFASGKKAVANGLQHLRMNNIGEEGVLVLDLLRTVPPKLAKDQHKLKLNDVLVCTTNSGKLVGKCALFDQSGAFAFSNHITRLRPKDNIIDATYLRWALWFAWKSGTYEELCQHWVNQSTLPKDLLMAVEIRLPPQAEQRRIVAKVEELLARANAARQRLAKLPAFLKRFRQSVLAAACSGRLTVDWRVGREGIEGASELVRKIAAARSGCMRNGRNRSADSEAETVVPDISLPDLWIYCRANQIATIGLGGTPSRKI